MRIIVCGSRYGYAPGIFPVMDALHARFKFSVLINGKASGVDGQAWAWAKKRNVLRIPFAARWTSFGIGAGPIRNKQMLDEGKPDLVIAFPGNTGTANMVEQALEAGVRVIYVDEKGNVSG